MNRSTITLFVTLVVIIWSSVVWAQNINEGQMYIRKGDEAYKSGDYTSALGHMEKALAIFEGLKNDQYISGCHMIIGEVLRNLGKNEDALIHFNKALEIAQRTNLIDIIGLCKNGIGLVYLSESRFEEAVLSFEEAYKLFVKSGNLQNESAAIQNLVVTLVDLGRYEETLPYLEKALSQARGRGDKATEALILVTTGQQYYYLGMFEKALPYFMESMTLYGTLNNKQGVGENITNIATVYWELGRYSDALMYFEDARKIFKELDYQEGLGAILTNSGIVFWEIGRYETALNYMEEGLKIYQEIGKKKEEANTLNNIGELYRGLGQFEQALSHFEKALQIYRQISDKTGTGTTLSNIGLVYMDLGQNDKALSSFKEALKLKKDVDNKNSTGFTLNNIGLIYRDSGRLGESLPYFEEARDIFRETGNKKGLGIALRNVGTVYFGQGRYEESFTNYRESLGIATEIGHVDGIYLSSWGLGRAYLGQGDLDNAIKYYQSSIEALESIRGGLSNEENRTSFIENKQAVYEELIRILIMKGQVDDAFYYMERARSRAFLDMLGTKNPTVNNERDVKLLKEEEEIRQTLASLNEMLDGKSGTVDTESVTKTRSVTESLRREIDETEKRYAKLREEMNTESHELTSLITVQPITRAEVQKIIPDGVRIVEYFTTDKKLIVFSLGKRDSRVYDFDVTRAELEKSIVRLRESIITSLISQDETEFLTQSRDLYETLMAPVLKDANETEHRIIIIAHGPLHYLPFSSLYDGEKYLIDDYTLINDPSASVLKFVVDKREDFGGKTLALGNPKTEHSSLPNAELEVSAIKDMLKDVDVYTGDAATETVGKVNFSKYNTIHLACHGKFWEDDPLSSSLYLARDGKNDGRLMVSELFGLSLPRTSLVVLSACETGLSKITGGDELIGLSRGFIYAGAPSLVVTLWEIADNSTADFMVMFYKNLKAGMDKPDALRQAQVWLKSRQEYRSPFYWAPFEIVGDWK